MSKYILLLDGRVLQRPGLQTEFLLILRQHFINVLNLPASQETKQTRSLNFPVMENWVSPFSFTKYNLQIHYGNITKHHSWFIQFSITNFLKISATQEYLECFFTMQRQTCKLQFQLTMLFSNTLQALFSPIKLSLTNFSDTYCPTHILQIFSIWGAYIWKRHLTRDLKIAVYFMYTSLKRF